MHDTSIKQNITAKRAYQTREHVQGARLSAIEDPQGNTTALIPAPVIEHIALHDWRMEGIAPSIDITIWTGGVMATLTVQDDARIEVAR